MNTTLIGHKAENAVARFLEQKGYTIIDRNWKTKSCEIDIVCAKDRVVNFVEVKYRSSSRHGAGHEYVNKSKQRRMRYAASVWAYVNRWEGDYRIGVASVSSQGMKVSFIESID